MRRARILLILGVWVAVLPYLGFPYTWKDVLDTLTGMGLIFFSYLMYKELNPKSKNRIFDNFRESDGASE